MHYYFVRVSVPNEELKQMEYYSRVFHATADSIMGWIKTYYGKDVDVIYISKLD